MFVSAYLTSYVNLFIFFDLKMKKYKSKTVIRLAFVLKFLRLEILITVQKLL